MAVIIASGGSGYSILQGIIAGILMAIGIYFLIWGVAVQWASAVAWNWAALAYYFIAILIGGIGCFMCCRSCCR
jgi:hypothetical protein